MEKSNEDKPDHDEKCDIRGEKPGTLMSRRQFIASGLIVAVGGIAALIGLRIGIGGGTRQSTEGGGSTAIDKADLQSTALEPTPSCQADGETPEVTEGPYFTPNSPERASLLEEGMQGTKLTVVGYVLSTECKPVAGALLDFWQANEDGNYDNAGYTLRGHQYTDANGKFTLQTIVPGLYPGRTRHIHVKAQAPGQSILTTQLFFPDEPGNASDNIYKNALLMKVQGDADGSKSAAFNFVLHNV